MQNDYFNESLFYKVDEMKPYPDKISFVLSFSKALYVIDYNDMQFDFMLN